MPTANVVFLSGKDVPFKPSLEQRMSIIRAARYSIWSAIGTTPSGTIRHRRLNELRGMLESMNAPEHAQVWFKEPLLAWEHRGGFDVGQAMSDEYALQVSHLYCSFIWERIQVADGTLELWRQHGFAEEQVRKTEEAYCHLCYERTGEKRFQRNLQHWRHPDFEWLCSNHSRMLPCPQCGGNQSLPAVRTCRYFRCAGCPWPYRCSACNQKYVRPTDFMFEDGMRYAICTECYATACEQRSRWFSGQGYWCIWCGRWQSASTELRLDVHQCNKCAEAKSFNHRYCHRCGLEFESATDRKKLALLRARLEAHYLAEGHHDPGSEAEQYVLQHAELNERGYASLCRCCLLEQHRGLLTAGASIEARWHG